MSYTVKVVGLSAALGMPLLAQAHVAVAPLASASSASVVAVPPSVDATRLSRASGGRDTTDSATAMKTTADTQSKAADPFAFADFSWLNGNSREKTSPLDFKAFTGEFRTDVSYIDDFNHPQDHTLVGSSESGRTSEFQLQQLGIGGDFNYDNVRGRLMTQFGMYSTMTPRNDASPARGQWDMTDAYRYISEAYGGYHWDKLNGINLDAGIFMSYVGLFSYYNYDNWAYQPSYVSSNTPWFFNGMRMQIFVSDKLKIEPWLVNGWQSYGMFNLRLLGSACKCSGVRSVRCRCSPTTIGDTTGLAFPIASVSTPTIVLRSNILIGPTTPSTREHSH